MESNQNTQNINQMGHFSGSAFKMPNMEEFSDDEINLVIINEFLDCYKSSQLFLTYLRDAQFMYYRMGYTSFNVNYDKLIETVNGLEFIKL